MASVNKCILVGNVGKDPEIRTTQGGTEIANFSLATSESWKDKNTGEKKERTEWHRIVIFNSGLVEIVKKYVSKGTKLYVEGAVQTRKWTDSNGQDKFTTEIVLQPYKGQIVLLGGTRRESAPEDQSQDTGNSDLDDSIPF